MGKPPMPISRMPPVGGGLSASPRRPPAEQASGREAPGPWPLSALSLALAPAPAPASARGRGPQRAGEQAPQRSPLRSPLPPPSLRRGGLPRDLLGVGGDGLLCGTPQRRLVALISSGLGGVLARGSWLLGALLNSRLSLERLLGHLGDALLGWRLRGLAAPALLKAGHLACVGSEARAALSAVGLDGSSPMASGCSRFLQVLDLTQEEFTRAALAGVLPHVRGAGRGDRDGSGRSPRGRPS